MQFRVAKRREEHHHELRVIRRGEMSIAHLSKPGMAISSLIVAEDILLGAHMNRRDRAVRHGS
jgi:hypothetical protein